MTWDQRITIGFFLFLQATLWMALGWTAGRRLLLRQVESAFDDPAATEWQRPGHQTRWCNLHDIPWASHDGAPLNPGCVPGERRVGPA